MDEMLVPIAVAGEFALIAIVVWVVARRAEQKARLRAELQMKVLDKFNTVRELEEFLKTDLGRRFLISYSPPARPPLARVALTIQIGVGACVVAVCGLILGAIVQEREVLAVGLVALTIGLALLAAAFVGRRLIRAWGLGGPAGSAGASDAQPS
jgi:hypothetical protein